MYKAVVVDDDPWTLVDIKASFPFSKFGFNVVAECTSAEEAFPIIEKHIPDLVITDVCMQSNSGLDLIRKCSQEGIETLFIILSGYDQFEYAQEAVKLGVFDYMLKPISDSEAYEAMKQVAKKLSNSKPTSENSVNISETDNFEKILKYLEINSEKDITLDKLSNIFFINRTYICDLFRKRLGKTFKRHINELRIKRACNLLDNTTLPIGTIAHRVGFDDAHYFTRVFKSVLEITPSVYKNRNC